MKRLLLFVLALVGTFPLFAYTPAVNDIDIKVTLRKDGSALIEETWDVVVAKGTEWYLVRNNLGDIRITDLSVVDEQGNVFFNEGRWDVDRNISQKARKCGLHYTSEGVEICWGVESYGPHRWTVSYVMSNVVKSLNDSDMLHMQFISDDISSPPQHARVTLEAPVSLDSDNSRIWSFGHHGTIDWKSGKVVAESERAFTRDASVILLLRFNKGIFESTSRQDRDFQEVLDRAQVGAYYPEEENNGDDDDDDPLASFIAMVFTFLTMWLVFIKPAKKALSAFGIGSYTETSRKRIKEIFGRRFLPAKPDWSRDLPFDGNHLRTYYIASHLKGNDDGKLSIIPAIMLRMIGHGNLTLGEDSKGKKEFHFNSAQPRQWMSNAEQEFYKMLIEASGSDRVLQEKEFKKWSSRHETEVKNWVNDIKGEVRNAFSDISIATSSTYYESIRLSPHGQEQAMQALGFKQFLKDFTIINERHAPEVTLWGDYLVIAALFGMADKVAADMKRLAPEIKIGNVSVHTASLGDMVILSNSFRNFTRSSYRSAVSSTSGGGGFGSGSSGGWGGHSSFGGGGGFSGGGSGGGSR